MTFQVAAVVQYYIAYTSPNLKRVFLLNFKEHFANVSSQPEKCSHLARPLFTSSTKKRIGNWKDIYK